jgi:hypothetical protein
MTIGGTFLRTLTVLGAALTSFVLLLVYSAYQIGAAERALERAGYRENIVRHVWNFHCPIGDGTIAFVSEGGKRDENGAEGYVCVGISGDASIRETKLPGYAKPDEP